MEVLKKEQIVKRFSYIAIAAYFILSAVNITMLTELPYVETVAMIGRYICYLLFVLVIIYHVFCRQCASPRMLPGVLVRYIKTHVILCVFVAVGAGVLLKTGDMFPLVLVLVVWGCSFYDFDVIIRIFLGAGICIMALAMVANGLELIPNIIITRTDMIRYSLGYIYPLETMCHYLVLVMAFLYICQRNFTVKAFVVINVLNVLLYKFTDSRTSFCMVIFVSVLMLIYAKKDMSMPLGKIKTSVCYLFEIVCAGFLFVCVALYWNGVEIMGRLDQWLSYRLYMTGLGFQKYGLSLFGNQIEWVGYGRVTNFAGVWERYNFVDCAYAKAVLDYGVIFTVLVLIGVGYAYKLAVERKQYVQILMISVMLVVSIMEPRLLSLPMNPFLILIGSFVLLENKEVRIRSQK